MKPLETPDLIEALLGLTNQASKAILKIYAAQEYDIKMKADESPLTEADLVSHRIISAGLSELRPDLPILSEENSKATPADIRRHWKRYWLVDPLDGTKEFIKRNGEFTVNIALVEFGRPILGIVTVPTTQTSYVGILGRSSTKYIANGTKRTLRVAGPVRNRPVRVVSSRSHGGTEIRQFADQLKRAEIITVGSSLKFCWLAEGNADVYPRLSPTCEWDTAAGHAILEAAGGSVTDLWGIPLRYNSKKTLINPSFIASGDLEFDYTQFTPQPDPV